MMPSLTPVNAILVGAALLAGPLHAEVELSGVYYYEPARLVQVRDALARGAADAEIRAAAEMLREEADDALRRGPYTVMDKQGTPPGGDKHDYVSYGVYWWPNPDTADGLPYIRRDGETNHELRAQGDRDRLSKMIDDVETLALGHYLLGRSDYAAHAAKLLRAWFLDDATRMNPHLRYAQAIPGVNQGRGSGIIDARGFVKFLDAIALLHHAGGLEESDMQGLRQWFQSYAKWLLTSEPGRKERAAKNNHGNWYAAQAARVALFVGDESTARELIEDARDNRLPHAIDGDGRQPEELTRTRSLHYSLFSLEAFACLARFGEALGIDLWGHRAEDGASIDSALAYVTPYVLDQEAWPYEQIHDYRLSPDIISFLRMADARYDNPLYARVIRDAPRSNRDRVYAPLLFEGGETRR